MAQSYAEATAWVPKSRNLGITLDRAFDAARAQRHRSVSLEHLLLMLIDDPDATMVLRVSDVNLTNLSTEISAFLGLSLDRFAPDEAGDPVASADLLRILDYAGAAAQQSKRREISGSIVLAAIVGEGKSAAAGMLRAEGLTFEQAIKALQRAGAPPARPQVAAAAPAPSLPPPMAPMPAEHGGPLHESRGEPPPQQLPAESRQRQPQPQPPPVHAEPPPPVPRPPAYAPADHQHHEPPAYAPQHADAHVPAEVHRPHPPQAEAYPPEPPPGPSHPAPHPREPMHLPPPDVPHGPPVMPPIPSAEEVLASVRHKIEASKAAAAQAAAEGAARVPSDRPPSEPPRAPYPAQPEQPAMSAGYGDGAQHWEEAPPPRSPPLPPSGWAPPPQQPVRRPPGVGAAAEAPPGSTILREAPSPRPAPPRSPSWPPAPQSAPGAPYDVQPGPASAPWLESARAGEATDDRGADPRHDGDIAGAPYPEAQHPYPETAPGAARRTMVEPGQMLENVPRTMRVGVPEQVEVRISKADAGMVARGMTGRHPVEAHDIVVTKAMSVRLRAPEGGFWIDGASPETQWIESTIGLMSDDFASWRWTVTPQRRGVSRLQLIVSARSVGPDGLAAETALPDQVFEVRVHTNYGQLARKLAVWAVVAAGGGAFATFGGQALHLAARAVGIALGP